MSLLRNHPGAKRCSRVLVAFASLWQLASATAPAAIITNPALPITHRVQVQLIQTALDDGSQPAGMMGTATQQATIERLVDQIWAQAGIDIQFLPSVIHFNNTFANRGTVSPRPTSDLNTIVSAARAAGKQNPDSHIVNMFFVQVPPGFSQGSVNSAQGLSYVGANGITQYVGSQLVSFAAGQDVAAEVIAHEIGHNLGLTHVTSAGNLMTSGVTTAQLTADQTAQVLNSLFVWPIPWSPDPADLNGDGTVGTADLSIWKSAFGGTTGGDVNQDGRTDGADLLSWQRAATPGASTIAAQVPEPSTVTLAVTAVGMSVLRRRSRSRRELGT